MLSNHRFPQHRARAVVALLAAALAALVLAACGGGSGGGSSSADAQTLLKQTFTGTHDIKSGKANLQLDVNAQGSPSIRGPIKLSISGPFQSSGSDQLPQFDLALDVSAQGQGFKAGLTSTSDQLFVNFGGTSYEVPASMLDQLKQSYKQSQQQSASKDKMSLQSLGLDPMSWLKDPTVEGSETVGGVETDHISAQLDVSALLDDVDKVLAKVSAQGLPGVPGATAQKIPSKIPADARKQIEDAVKSASVDVWSGKDDHTLRKLTLALGVEPPKSGSGPTSLDLKLTIELSDLNQPQTIKAPASSRPLNELLGQLQGLFGGALGGSSGLGDGSSSGSAGSGASSEALQKYSQCIQEAGGDVSKAQQCAALLTK